MVINGLHRDPVAHRGPVRSLRPKEQRADGFRGHLALRRVQPVSIAMYHRHAPQQQAARFVRLKGFKYGVRRANRRQVKGILHSISPAIDLCGMYGWNGFAAGSLQTLAQTARSESTFSGRTVAVPGSSLS